jgi:hypothetical protein
VPTTKLRKRPESRRFFLDGSFIKSTKKNKVSNMKEKARKLGLPPHAIISELLTKNVRSHVQIKATRLLPESFLARRKKGIAITAKTKEDTIFNAENSSKNLRKISSRTKKLG